MNADFGAPKELAGGLQQRRALYQPRLPPCLQVIDRPLRPSPLPISLYVHPCPCPFPFLGLVIVVVTPVRC